MGATSVKDGIGNIFSIVHRRRLKEWKEECHFLFARRSTESRDVCQKKTTIPRPPKEPDGPVLNFISTIMVLTLLRGWHEIDFLCV